MIWVHVHVCVVRVAKDSCMNGNPTLMNSLLVPCHLLTFTEIHPPPQVVKVRLPDLNVISSLDKTSIQGFLKGICRRRTFQMIKILQSLSCQSSISIIHPCGQYCLVVICCFQNGVCCCRCIIVQMFCCFLLLCMPCVSVSIIFVCC